MDSGKIKALLLAVECGSLTRAAEKLGYTQAGLTHMMTNLENETGLKLLRRDKNGVRLTPDGEALLPSMREFALSSDRLSKSVLEIRTRTNEHIRIGAYTSILKEWLPGLIRDFRKLYPGITFDIRDTSIADLCKRVGSCELDVGFGSRQENSDCRFIYLCDDPLFAVLPADCGWKEVGGCIPISSFQGRTFLMPTYGVDPDVLRVLEQNRVEPVISSASISDSSVIAMVRMGLGVSILPELVLRGLDKAGAKVCPILPHAARELGMIVPRQKSPNPHVRSFIRFCEKKLADSGRLSTVGSSKKLS